MTSRTARQLSLIAVIALFLNIFSPFAFVNLAHAATLTEASIRLDRMGAGVAASSTDKILVVFKPASTATEASLKITWPTTNAFTVDATAANHTTSTTGLPSTYMGESLVAVPSLSATASTVSSGDVTFTTGDLTAGTLYGFYITGGITNPTTGNAGQHNVTIATQDSTPATIDSSTVTVDTTTTNADQVTITASVGSTFSFALGGNSISLGALDKNSIKSGTVAVTVDSNAANGYVAWLRSANAGLTSATAGHTIGTVGSVDGTPESISSGSENFLANVSVSQNTGGGSNGTVTVDGEYNGNGTSTAGTLSTGYQEIAYSTGQANADSITLKALASISSLTPAASDYTDTWDVVGAGNF